MKTVVSIEGARQEAAAGAPPPWLDDLRQITGAEHLSVDFDARLKHSRDRIPLGRFRHRSAQLTGTLPSAIVEPDSIDELRRIVRFAVAHRIPVIPYGSGSGVLGGTVPLQHEMVIDLNRMNRILTIDEINATATAEAGVNGGVLEKALRERGFTCGHYPQSLEMSTVGGWAACRGSGQSSSRYGSIESMVVGMKAVLPDGELMEVRPAPRRSVGPSLIEFFIGSEGVFGVIAELTLRIRRLPAHTIERVVAFPGISEALDALRAIMQAELRPSIARLYDEGETARWGQEAVPAATHPVLCMLEFAGTRGVAESEAAAALGICESHNAVPVDIAPLTRWKSCRFQSHSDEFVDAGWFYDTIEVAAPWTALPEMYARIRGEVTGQHPEVQLTAHWSHVYSDGACMYMTAKFPPMDDERGMQIHAGIWETAMRICLEMGGTISHHHGIGFFRNPWLADELNAGLGVLRALKRSIDPGFLFNPGKLGLGEGD